MSLEALIATLAGLGFILLLLIIVEYRRASVRHDIKLLEVRFNAIKTIPLTFKLNKATFIAKINDELAMSVEAYRSKIEKAQKDIDDLQQRMDDLDNNLANKKFKKCKTAIIEITELMTVAEDEVEKAEIFLDSITQKEQIQREHANELKDRYRDLKALVNRNANELTIAYDGVMLRLKKCEALFSSFEEQIYANEFVQASEALDNIDKNIDAIKESIVEIPSLIEMAKGTLPTLIEEVEKYYSEIRAKGVCTNNVSVESSLKEITSNLNKCTKAIVSCSTEGIGARLLDYQRQLEEILEALKREDGAFEELKKLTSSLEEKLLETEKTFNYINKVYETSHKKYDLSGLVGVIEKTPSVLMDYRKDFSNITLDTKANMQASSAVLKKAKELDEKVTESLKDLKEHKESIDKTSSDEARANTQIVKLQIVLNEIDVKIAQYRLPTISEDYTSDMKKGHEYIAKLKSLLDEIPLNITKLSEFLNEAIDFIYKLYNDVNNVVGMAVMIEIAIVLGNKYRSSYPFIDSELSKAEFCYINGEYTQALTIALACIDKLIPNNGDEKILEYAKSAE